ncbi:MAG: nucleotidyltransferase domain-containing protein [Limnochordia bacterium]|nr:nucleotidyltransferase domain-containing protein [Limnochordia bacterium]
MFKNHGQVERVVIYGSRAKGNYSPGSDIDLVMMGSGLKMQDVLDIRVELEELNLPYFIDLSILETIKNPDLLEHIKRVGLLFYQRRK